MGIYIEALILYILIFLSRSAGLLTGVPAEGAGFSIRGELVKIFFYYIPSLAIIWHLIIKTQKIDIWISGLGKKDIKAALITFPCLLVTGFAVAFASSIIGVNSAVSSAGSLPSSILDWITLCFSCMIFAYLEESYFRYYLLTNRDELNLNVISALALSVTLFTVCHISGGPWSIINAFIGGSVLGFMFLKYNSFHGAAIAHGLYNIAVFAVNSFKN